MFCSKCGVQIEEGKSICSNCGSPVENSVVDNQMPNYSNEAPNYNYQQTANGGYWNGGYSNGGYPNGGYPNGGYPYVQKSRLAAGLLQIFLGWAGIGRFYLGYTGIGVAQLLVSTFTCGIGTIWPFIDGILILTGSVSTDAQGVPLKE